MTALLESRIGRALREALAPPGPVSFAVSEGAATEIVARSPRGRAVGRILVRLSGVAARFASLRVSPLWRGRGIGRALLERACAVAAARGARSATLAVSPRNDVARRLYASAGFAPRGARANEEWSRAL